MIVMPVFITSLIQAAVQSLTFSLSSLESPSQPRAELRSSSIQTIQRTHERLRVSFVPSLSKVIEAPSMCQGYLILVLRKESV